MTAIRPALQRRARLIERQPTTLRRRSTRLLSRAAVIATFDLWAFLIARAVAARLVGPVLAAGSDPGVAAGPLAPPGAPASLIFPAVLFSALVLGGTYVRRRPTAAFLRLAMAAAVATMATAVTLATLIGVHGALVHASLVGVICFIWLGVGRLLGHLFTDRVWPRNRDALPAVRLSTAAADSAPRNWSEYAITHDILWERGLSGPSSRLIQDIEDSASRGVEAVIITDDLPHEVLVPVTHEALDLGLRVIFPPRAVEIEGVRPRIIWHQGAPFFELSTPAIRPGALLAKRISDVVGASALLIVAAPLMLLIALGIRLDSPGPVFYRQDRAGLGGRRFRMLKFRTMNVGADERKQDLTELNRSGDVRLFKIPGDPRVTRIGRFLRRWSLDELPQLINVLRGEMSLVGPRPFFESDFAAYEDRHFRRLDTKPGITGLWQVSGRSDVVDFEDVVFLDRQYIEQWSLWLDLSLLVRTIPAVLRRHGAY